MSLHKSFDKQGKNFLQSVCSQNSLSKFEVGTNRNSVNRIPSTAHDEFLQQDTNDDTSNRRKDQTQLDLGLDVATAMSVQKGGELVRCLRSEIHDGGACNGERIARGGSDSIERVQTSTVGNSADRIRQDTSSNGVHPSRARWCTTTSCTLARKDVEE